jgi:glycosyltransferase involved in cell wall biosynthesis
MAAVVPYALGQAPGQRTRIELWAGYLEKAGWAVDFHPFEDAALHEILYTPGLSPAKAARLLACYRRHLLLAVKGVRCDLLYVYREASLVGPALTERLLHRQAVPLVYDLDDPIFLLYRSPANGWMSLMKFHRKTHALFRMSDRVIAINRLIGDYAARYNPSVSVIPICVDTERNRPIPAPAADEGPVRVAWSGSFSTVANLATIAGPLRRLQAETAARMRVVSSDAVQLDGVDVEFRKWSADGEMDSLADCHIGVVPLADRPWNRWKFNYKTVQYMAVGLPVVASRMGSNVEIVVDGVNGYLVDTEEEWFDRLRTLASDTGLRRRMGAAARATVVEHYSLKAQMPRMVSIFDDVLARHATAATDAT